MHAPPADHRPAADIIRQHGAPRIGLVLGSGLGGVADAVEGATVLSYGELPGFPVPAVGGHAGKLVLGRLGGQPVAVFQGRKHAYEGRVDAMAVPIRALRAAGAEMLVLTASSGSTRLEVGPGSLVLIEDHLNLMFQNPLAGPNDDGIGPRFPPMEDAYDPGLRHGMRMAARALDLHLPTGVHAAILGPSFETPAEVRMMKALGADTIGMSIIPECILARHCGLKVAAVTAITNFGVGLTEQKVNHDQTLDGARLSAENLTKLMIGFCQGLE